MHKTPNGARFIVASRKCITKTSKSFKLSLSIHFYLDYKMLWVVENSKPVIDRLDQINTIQNAKLISTFDFMTLYTKLSHKDLLKVIFDLIDFGFDGGSKKKISFS